MKKRIISISLVLSLMAPVFVVPTSAVAALPGGVAVGATSVLTSATLAKGAAIVVSSIATMLGAAEDNVQAVLDYLVSVTGVGNLGHEGLQSACNRLNQIAANPRKYVDLMYQDGIGLQVQNFPVDAQLLYSILVQLTAYQNDLLGGWHIIEHQDYGYVIVNQSETFILADSVGRYPYAQDITDKWLGSRTALDSTTAHIATNYMLNNLQDVQEALHPDWSFRQISVTLQDGKYLVLQAAEDGIHYNSILCDENGFPYGVSQAPTQAGSDRDYNNDNPDQPEVSDEPIVDIDGDFVMQMFPDGSWTWINGITYDASNKTYNIDASTTYDVDNETYYYFEWNYTYHIDYTSITYIGATEEYTETYEYYFDLPDGRSSADLTVEDLLALNTAIDVVPYIRTADDTSIRALYHFDGNTNDSSYWNYLGKFDWETGASLTYMDSNAFNGALYLDENLHKFTFSLPSNIYSGDFTLQFRYYQSATATPVSDSYIWINGWSMANFDGANIYISGQTKTPLPIGSWNEVCIIREDNTQYLYLNGVCINQRSLPNSLGNKILFKFGSEQQTYKYLDELRFLDYALVSGGEDYTPTSVPHDTNLALVLPDSVVPVADEYWSVTSSRKNLLTDYGLDFTRNGFTGSSYFKQHSDVTGFSSSTASSFTPANTWPYLNMITPYTALMADQNSLSLMIADSTVMDSLKVATGRYIPATGLFSLASVYSGGTGYTYYLPEGTYTLSLVFDDGEVASCTFNSKPKIDDDGAHDVTVSSHGVEFGLMYESWLRSSDNHNYHGYLRIRPESSEEYCSPIVYMELVEGSTTDLTAEKVTSVAGMDAKQFKTPTLAVRTDLEITSYQIGGVRPSIPEKGLVWALVEDGRITSLQIYNGQAWESVDGRIWTGSRWVPYYAYDVLLLKDLYDIVESDPSLDYIYTESGFWKWLQSAWERMMVKLEEIRLAVGGGASPDASTLPGADDDPTTEEDEGWKFIDLVVIVKDGVWKIVTGVVSTGVNGISGLADGVSKVGGFFDAYDPDTSGGVLDIMNVGSSAVWD